MATLSKTLQANFSLANLDKKCPHLIIAPGTITVLFFFCFLIVYLTTFSADKDLIWNFTLATSSKFVLTGPGQSIEILTFDF